MKTAFMFPGQGSQYAGMGKELAGQFRSCSDVFKEADEVLGFSLSKLCFEGPDADLKLTQNTQPAILATSIAIWKVLETSSAKPAYVAGHSLGEYSALVAAGSLTFSDALRLVRKRGSYMQEAVPVGEGAMAAIIGLKLEEIKDICAQAAEGNVISPANLNSPTQIVIAGDAKAVARAMERTNDRGGRAIQLPVSAPFHCALMQPAQERLALDLQNTIFKDLEVPLVTNVDAQIILQGHEASDSLRRQVTAPVRWYQSIERLTDHGTTTFVEIGPGKVLSGLVRKINPSAKTFNIEDKKSLDIYLSAQGKS